MELTTEQRFDLLKIEMQLIQGIFNKYDEMIFQSRRWFVTLWMATIGLGLSLRVPILILMAAGLAFLYWALEGLMRYQYWYKYVIRYRALREAFNNGSSSLDKLSVYDLTNIYGGPMPTVSEQLKASFIKLEPILLYLALGAAAVVLWTLVNSGVINSQSAVR